MLISQKVSSLLHQNYPGQFPALDIIARSLHMSESSLRRRLRRENTNISPSKID